VKLQKCFARQGGSDPDARELHRRAEATLARIGRRLTAGENGGSDVAREIAELLAASAHLARKLGVDPERVLCLRNQAFEELCRGELRRRTSPSAAAGEEVAVEEEVETPVE
jgi:hypothetical protein